MSDAGGGSWFSGAGREFVSRTDGGVRLGEALAEYRDRDPVVFGVARGGVVIASAVAGKLGCEFDVVVARKLAVPWNPEAGFGAVAEGGCVLYAERMVKRLNVSESQIESRVEELNREVEQRLELYRGKRPRRSAAGRVAIVVDDGIASGYTLAASVEALKEEEPELLVAAAPAASASGVSLVSNHADEVKVLIEKPPAEPFAVGFFYQDFSQVSDEEVASLLAGGGGEEVAALLAGGGSDGGS